MSTPTPKAPTGRNKEKSDWLVVRRPGSPVLFFIVIFMVIAIGWSNDYNSCLRQQHPRNAVLATANYFEATAARLDQRAMIDNGTARVLDLRAAAAARKTAKSLIIPKLRCFTFLPPTG